jgi:mannitol-1-/sugar-/sorbitol-6-phosphatase
MPVSLNEIRCSGVLFDLDGVLVDSDPAVTRVWGSWAREHGFDPQETVRRAHGRPSLATVRDLLPNGDYEKANREVERREIEDIEGLVPLPGVINLLGKLPDDKWTIVTSCTRALASIRLNAAGLPFPRVLTTFEDVTEGKPAPEPYVKGAATLGLTASDCIVIEDAPAGIRAGKAAGARVIALRTSETGPSLLEAGADWLVDDCRAIEAALDQACIVLKLHGA